LEGLGQGADAYLTKPFDKKELLLRIKNLLELRRQLQQYYRTSLDVGFSEADAITPPPDQEDEQIGDDNKSIPLANSLDNAFVIKVRKEIEAHLDDSDFDVEKLCRSVALSNSQVHRKLSALTGLSATHFIRYVRLVKAKELMIDSRFKIAAIAIDCGFNDAAYFSRVFKKEFGMTPQKWRNQNTV
jgi:AraC-like DNA-binding protein